MAEEHLVCEGAICMCKFGSAPDTLKVKSQKKEFINEASGSKKMIATTKEIGSSTFKANTFGPCKMQPMGSSFKPCQIVVTAWQHFYDKTQLANGGHILTEKSKATCPIGGPDCISVTFHGQTPQPTAKNVENAKEEVMATLFPFGNLKRLNNDLNID
jgi:hypothetical protein